MSWDLKNHYQAEDVRYVKGKGKLYRLVYEKDGVMVQGYDVAGRVYEELITVGMYDFYEKQGTSLVSSFLGRWRGLLSICWRK